MGTIACPFYACFWQCSILALEKYYTRHEKCIKLLLELLKNIQQCVNEVEYGDLLKQIDWQAKHCQSKLQKQDQSLYKLLGTLINWIEIFEGALEPDYEYFEQFMKYFGDIFAYLKDYYNLKDSYYRLVEAYCNLEGLISTDQKISLLIRIFRQMCGFAEAVSEEDVDDCLVKFFSLFTHFAQEMLVFKQADMTFQCTESSDTEI